MSCPKPLTTVAIDKLRGPSGFAQARGVRRDQAAPPTRGPFNQPKFPAADISRDPTWASPRRIGANKIVAGVFTLGAPILSGGHRVPRREITARAVRMARMARSLFRSALSNSHARVTSRPPTGHIDDQGFAGLIGMQSSQDANPVPLDLIVAPLARLRCRAIGAGLAVIRL
jgi:hypothetical protein